MFDHDEYGLAVVCYDIASNRRRRQVVRELEAFGVRVQESVFECWLNNDGLRRLKALLARAIRADEDSVAYYRLPPAAVEDALLLGAERSADPGCFVL